MWLARELAEHQIDWEPIAVTQQPWLGNALTSITHRFLASDCDRLLVLDDDVVFDPKDVIKIITSARDCVGGDYALKARGAGMLSRRLPGGRVDGDHVECIFIGLGFSSFSRACIEAVAELSPVFQLDERDADAGQIARCTFHSRFVDGRRIDDDVVFFDRVMKAGFTAWLDTSIRLGHVGTHVYTSDDSE